MFPFTLTSLNLIFPMKCAGCKYLWFRLWNLDLEEETLLLVKMVTWVHRWLKMTWIHGLPGHTDHVLYHYYLLVHAFLCEFISNHHMFFLINLLVCDIAYCLMSCLFSINLKCLEVYKSAIGPVCYCNWFCLSIIARVDASSLCYKFKCFRLYQRVFRCIWKFSTYNYVINKLTVLLFF